MRVLVNATNLIPFWRESTQPGRDSATSLNHLLSGFLLIFNQAFNPPLAPSMYPGLSYFQQAEVGASPPQTRNMFLREESSCRASENFVITALSGVEASGCFMFGIHKL